MTAFYLTHPQVEMEPARPVPLWRLSGKGRARVEALLDRPWLRSVKRILSSDETKAVEAAAIVGAHLGVAVEIDREMGENDRSSTGFLEPPAFEAAADRFFGEPEPQHGYAAPLQHRRDPRRPPGSHDREVGVERQHLFRDGAHARDPGRLGGDGGEGGVGGERGERGDARPVGEGDDELVGAEVEGDHTFGPRRYRSGREEQPQHGPDQHGRSTRHGLPAATTFAGRLRVTTDPAPTTVFSPIDTPGQTIAPPPSHTPSPIAIARADSQPARRVAASIGWVAV